MMDSSKKARKTSYEIVVDGHLDAAWASWFDGFNVSPKPDGTTMIYGPIADQSALHGVLEKIRDLNIELISLRRK